MQPSSRQFKIIQKFIYRAKSKNSFFCGNWSSFGNITTLRIVSPLQLSCTLLYWTPHYKNTLSMLVQYIWICTTCSKTWHIQSLQWLHVTYLGQGSQASNIYQKRHLWYQARLSTTLGDSNRWRGSINLPVAHPEHLFDITKFIMIIKQSISFC